MGDRANIALYYGPKYPTIYLYSHWGGTGIASSLQASLKRNWRWDDDAYLARIIARDLFADIRETGYGLSPYMPDNEHPVLTVNLAEQTVSTEHQKAISFAAFVALADPEEWMDAHA